MKSDKNYDYRNGLKSCKGKTNNEYEAAGQPRVSQQPGGVAEKVKGSQLAMEFFNQGSCMKFKFVDT